MKTHTASCEDPMDSVGGLRKAERLKDKDGDGLCTFGDSGI